MWRRGAAHTLQREFFIYNLLVRIHSIIVMIRWTGLAPWGFEFHFPGSLTSTFLDDDLDGELYQLECGGVVTSPPQPYNLNLRPFTLNPRTLNFKT